MDSGIRATIEFDRPDICPIVATSAAAEARVESVSRSVCDGDCAAATSEFRVQHDADDPAALANDGLSVVFSQGSFRRYRFTHKEGGECPCACLGSLGCPISRYIADEGTLRIEFCASGFDELQTLVGAVRERFPDADLTRLVRAPTGGDVEDVVPVDRSTLTARQLEVLRAAQAMGYFENPRRANVAAIADELDIHPSTVSEHLKASQRKLLDQLL